MLQPAAELDLNQPELAVEKTTTWFEAAETILAAARADHKAGESYCWLTKSDDCLCAVASQQLDQLAMIYESGDISCHDLVLELQAEVDSVVAVDDIDELSQFLRQEQIAAQLTLLARFDNN